MATEYGREVQKASDRYLARERLPIFAGQDMPSTIVRKEIIDNCIDIVSEKGQKATKSIIMISPNRLKVMDNGAGISANCPVTEEGQKKFKDSSLWLACAKMFTSSNYDENGGKNSQDTLGANGVGMTIANYTSAKFNIINFNPIHIGRGDNRKSYVNGLSFTNGFLNGTSESGVSETGNFITDPLEYEIAKQKFNPLFETGFLIDVTWELTPNNLFQDTANVNWLYDYTVLRTGEMTSGTIEIYVFNDDSFLDGGVDVFDSAIKSWKGTKNEEEISEESNTVYAKSWKEKIEALNDETHPIEIIKDGPWTFAFGIQPFEIESMCQGAPINSRYTTTVGFEIQEYKVNMSVPFTMQYRSDVYPNYTDQTKVAVRFPYSNVSRAFEKTDKIYKYFYREAEKSYMAHVIKESDSTMFWPALGNGDDNELIIAEGYSAISGLKSQRNPMTQACIALRGKILNCWNLDMVKAMRSDVVKQILNAVLYNKYKRIIIAVDADDDGNHIGALLISLFHRFTNIIQEGRLYYVHTPHYLFKKRGKELLWSDNAADCPAGYHVTTLKGLGGMTPEEVSTFIMEAETRDLVQIQDDPKAWESLDEAFTFGGEHWILSAQA